MRFCARTGIWLIADREYRIKVEQEEPWFDRTAPADVGGFTTDSWRHRLATPLEAVVAQELVPAGRARRQHWQLRISADTGSATAQGRFSTVLQACGAADHEGGGGQSNEMRAGQGHRPQQGAHLRHHAEFDRGTILLRQRCRAGDPISCRISFTGNNVGKARGDGNADGSACKQSIFKPESGQPPRN